MYLGQESYLESLWSMLSNPTAAYQVLQGNPQYSAITGTATIAPNANALGYLTQAQKDQLVQQEAANLVQASGGSMPQSQAQAQAQSDVTTVLRQAGADPSQNPVSASLPWIWLALGAGGLVLLVLALK